MEHLLSAWAKVARQLKETNHVLLLTDYDGTLTPIVERPELASLSENTRKLLAALAGNRKFTVGVISGRSLSDLKDKVRVSNIIYAGNHGLEIEGPGWRFVSPLAQEFKPILRLIRYVLNRVLSTIRGVLVEDKELTLSVHYRMVAPDKTEEVKSAVTQVVSGAQAAGKVRLTSGKKVFEVRPAIQWDKGKALKMLIEKYGSRYRKALVMYLGDDLTDEDGFKVIEEYENGISIYVGEEGEEVRESAARYYLKSPAEVTNFLAMLAKQSQRGFK